MSIISVCAHFYHVEQGFARINTRAGILVTRLKELRILTRLWRKYESQVQQSVSENLELGAKPLRYHETRIEASQARILQRFPCLLYEIFL